MKILNSTREGDIVRLEIEESPEAIQKSVDKAFRKLSKKVQLPGFRKGHITQSLFEKYFGKSALIEEALNDRLSDTYAEAVNLLELRVVDSPKNITISEYKENEPITFTCEVDVVPKVVLGVYDQLTVTVSEDSFSEEAIEKQMAQLQNSYSTFESVARPVAQGDRVLVNTVTLVGEDRVPDWSTKDMMMAVGDAQFGEAVDQSLVGAVVGDTVVAEDTFPEGHPVSQIAGKTASISVEVKEVQEKKIPEFDDAFAKKTSGMDTVAAFREDLKKRLIKEVEEKNREKRQEALIDALLAVTELSLQDVLVQREMSHMFSDFEARLKRIGYSADAYFRASGQTKETVVEGYRDAAIKRLKSDLALETVAEAEGVVITDETMREEIRSWDAPDLQTEDQVAAYLQKIDQRGFKELLRRRKALELLESKANIVLAERV